MGTPRNRRLECDLIAAPRQVDVQRLVAVVSGVVFLDTLFYAVIAPLLPGLSHQLHLSKLSAGLLTASYPIGTLLASLPGGVLAVRAGPRVTVCLGMALLAVSTIAFGFLHSVVGLDVARFSEGVGGACSWAGGLTWIVTETPIERRGAMMGRALAAGIGGAMVGPAVGALATLTGRPVLFCVIAVIAVGLIFATLALPTQGQTSDQGLDALFRAIRRRPVVAAMWLMALPAVVSGMVNVLGPLRLHRFGAGAGAIGAIFLISAGLEAAISPTIGSFSDRRGRMLPLRAGLAGVTVALLCFTLPGTAALLGGLLIVTACVLGAFWAPAMAMLSEVSESSGLEQGMAAALMSLAWAGGQIVGSGGGGAAAKVSGDILPTAVVAGLCAATLLVVARAGSAVGAAELPVA